MAEEPLSITILGSGTSTGVPVVGCDCDVCRSELSKNKRLRCSALLAWGDYRVLIDSSTDLRQQALNCQLRRIDAVLYTHTHADHVHGIDDLRCFNALSGQDIPAYGPQWLLDRLAISFPYVFSDGYSSGFRPRLKPVVIRDAFELLGRRVEPVFLCHGSDEVVGYRLGKMAYLTDCNHIPQAAMQKLYGLDLLVIDALRFREHQTHFTVEQAIAVADQLEAKRVVLTHLSHDVEYERDSKNLPAHVEFAYDGLSVTL